MKVALVYDRVNKWGGAERVLLALHDIWVDAPLYTSVYDPALAPWAKEFDVRTSFIQKSFLPKNEHEKYPFIMGVAFEQFDFDEYDVVISVTSEFGKAIITKPKTLHVCYCLTPTGYLWTGHDHYFSSKSSLFKMASAPIINYLRFYDKIVSQRPDVYLAISREVQNRIKKYYRRDSQVIYPPVDVDWKAGNVEKKYSDEKFFLVVCRLAPNKRVDLAIRAFNHLHMSLKIVGVGNERTRLQKIAGPTVEFLGSLTDGELAGYYSQCAAVIVPAAEDFGIVAVEAQSFGKPVVAFRGGGNQETIIEGKTGWLFEEPSWGSLAEMVARADVVKINPGDCRENARKYSRSVFKQNMRHQIEALWEKYLQNVQ